MSDIKPTHKRVAALSKGDEIYCGIVVVSWKPCTWAKRGMNKSDMIVEYIDSNGNLQAKAMNRNTVLAVNN